VLSTACTGSVAERQEHLVIMTFVPPPLAGAPSQGSITAIDEIVRPQHESHTTMSPDGHCLATGHHQQRIE
jgi:hypothetical protein